MTAAHRTVVDAYGRAALGESREFSCELPAGARVVNAGRDALDRPCLWVLADWSQRSETRGFRVLTTGADVADDEVHVASFKDDFGAGVEVVHLFERKGSAVAAALAEHPGLFGL